MASLASVPFNIVILASGNGSNAQRIAEYFLAGTTARVAAILSDNPRAGVLHRAHSLGIPHGVLSQNVYTHGPSFLEVLAEYQPDLVVLAGYLKHVPDDVVRAYKGRIVNIHPALLPRYGGKGMYGHHVHAAVIAAGDAESGITIHHVNERYDEGEHILQVRLPVLPGTTPEALAQAIHALEYEHYPRVIEQLLSRMPMKKPASALISVYHKDGLAPIVRALHARGVHLISTGGTATFLRELGLPVTEAADLTAFPSILGGRVKTLHPKIFGGILARRAEAGDIATLEAHDIPPIDLVIVDLYPFEDTVAAGGTDAEIIEKIDIGGISLIRAAAKNFADVICVPSRAHYARFLEILEAQDGAFSLEQRKQFAAEAFDVSSHYDTHIHQYLLRSESSNSTSTPGTRTSLKVSEGRATPLRYGENPHQAATFYGPLDNILDQLHGKALSYNNLLDVDAALNLLADFQEGAPFFAVIKHTNPCGAATGEDLLDAWRRALECDPVSAFGGILAANDRIDVDVAAATDEIFFEVMLAPDYTPEALALLTKKKNRILLRYRDLHTLPAETLRTAVNGVLVQQKDAIAIDPGNYAVKASRRPTEAELADIVFGEKLGKHLKSNAIAIAAKQQLIGSGAGQTSRVDALKQAIQKARDRGFPLEGSILYSDAFFPFKDCAEIAFAAGIRVLAEPGGSIRDAETVEYCETHDMCLIFTHHRHFKH